MGAARRTALAAAACAGAAALALGAPQATQRTAAPQVTCTHVEGASVARLLRETHPGEVGCLRGGDYDEDVTIDGDDVTLRSVPGERATIHGRLWVTRASRGATVADVDLDGRNARDLPSPTVNGQDATFVGVDATNGRTGICFLLGSPGWGRAVGTTIERSRVHDCGRLPSTNLDHGIYVSIADRTTIRDSVIDDNADRGIQLYPDAHRTRIVGNVIVGNGEGIIFGGEGRRASSDNVVTGNIIAGSRLRHDVESFYGPGTVHGRGNVVRGNCVHGGRQGTIDRTGGGFSASGNVVADPGLDADLAPAPGTTCVAVLRGSTARFGVRDLLARPR